ncbi:MAG: CDP-alcohol phosphatidyltransferase family protein [Rhodospirillales bacterium]|nr:MAG: CDP-alcohol phosphatidyltransferase family protein [Rhodospirillales bacterium]
MKALPNLISMARVLAVPVVVWLILADRMTAAFWVFVAAGVSDAIDGYLANRLKARSVLGSYLDPLADKLLLVAIYLLLGRAGHVPVWLVVLVIARDAALLGGSLLVVRSDRITAMRPLLVSKLNTSFQIVLAALVMAQLGLGWPDIGIGKDILVYAVAVTTVVSGSAYLWRMRRGSATGEPGDAG